MPAEAEGVKSLRAYEKLLPIEQAAYQLGQQSMARPTPAPKASSTKKGKGRARESTPPDPCTACVTANAEKDCVAQDAKNAVACNRCHKKKLQCSWRSSKGLDLHLVEIEERLGRIVGCAGGDFGNGQATCRSCGGGKRVEEVEDEVPKSSTSESSKRKLAESEDHHPETENGPVKTRMITMNASTMDLESEQHDQHEQDSAQDIAEDITSLWPKRTM
ncbi:hypothetical protein MPER_04506 [Moniliophthora perniciosa FA553]|nr:hypothetical protein MPER_04506 [Moniliophthora perniciosa FA553]